MRLVAVPVDDHRHEEEVAFAEHRRQQQRAEVAPWRPLVRRGRRQDRPGEGGDELLDDRLRAEGRGGEARLQRLQPVHGDKVEADRVPHQADAGGKPAEPGARVEDREESEPAEQHQPTHGEEDEVQVEAGDARPGATRVRDPGVEDRRGDEQDEEARDEQRGRRGGGGERRGLAPASAGERVDEEQRQGAEHNSRDAREGDEPARRCRTRRDNGDHGKRKRRAEAGRTQSRAVAGSHGLRQGRFSPAARMRSAGTPAATCRARI